MTANVIREEKEWAINLSEIDREIDGLLFNIRRLDDPEARADLLRLHRNVADLREDVSRESVRCRGFNRTTGNMQNLQKSLNEALEVLTQMVTMALLME